MDAAPSLYQAVTQRELEEQAHLAGGSRILDASTLHSSPFRAFSDAHSPGEEAMTCDALFVL